MSDSACKHIWRPVNGYEGHYEVSNSGLVRSLSKKVKTWNGTALRRGKTLKQILSSTGYPVVSLSKSCIAKQKFVHNLVLEAFSGLPAKGHVCRHLDGTRTNNNLSNLMWGTHKENAMDAVRHGTATWLKRQKRAKP